MRTPSDSCFDKAADRHLQDAKMLCKAERLANSDHLAGIAAECALKAILVGYLGCTVRRGKPVYSMDPPARDKVYNVHVQELWPQMNAFAEGRRGSMFHALLSQSNPFERWDPSERYSDGSHIDPHRVNDHLEAASRTLKLHQQAKVDGALP